MKTAIVTGASGNLGEAIVKRFLREKLQVVGTVTSSTSTSSLNEKDFTAYVVDLTDEEAAAACVAQAIVQLGKIDIGVMTVGGFAPGKIIEADINSVRHQIQLNFETTYNIARPVFLHMLEQGSGKLFLTGARTGSAMRFSKTTVAYGLSKSLIFRLAELMNEEAKGTDVTVTIISPSTIDTPANRKAMPDADFNKWVSADDIAEIVYAQCTPAFKGLRDHIIKAYNQS